MVHQIGNQESKKVDGQHTHIQSLGSSYGHTGLDKLFCFRKISRLNLENMLVVVKSGDFLQLS